jgi:hypothetical protein
MAGGGRTKKSALIHLNFVFAKIIYPMNIKFWKIFPIFVILDANIFVQSNGLKDWTSFIHIHCQPANAINHKNL